MTDERFVFQQDVKERSKMKTGAMHKKNGSKSKQCKFPSDYLSKKEKEKLSGPVISIKMDQPYYGWDEFIKLPQGLQIEYLNGLINNYGARQKDILEMFGINHTSAHKVFSAYDPPLIFKRGRAAQVMDEKWLDFITKPGFVQTTKETKKEEVKEEVKEMPKKTDEQIIEEVFGIKFETDIPATEPEVEEVKVEEPSIELDRFEPDGWEEEVRVLKAINKKPVGYNSVLKMNLDLKGTKEEIMFMLDAILGPECNYSISLKIINTDREESG